MKVWKYDTDTSGRPFDRSLPVGADILCVAMQHDEVVFWALVNPDAPRVDRSFVVVGTGHDVPDWATYRGTVQLLGGQLVLHLFELPQ